MNKIETKKFVEENIKTWEDFLLFYRKNKDELTRDLNWNLTINLCYLIAKAKIATGEISKEELKENEAWWLCLKDNFYRRFPTKEQLKAKIQYKE